MTTRTLVVATLAASLAGLTGCIRATQEITVMPDGAGKMEMTFGFNQQAMGGMMGDDDPTDLDLDELDKNVEGFVAFTEPQQREDGPWKLVSFTGYFEDINQVRLKNDEHDPNPTSYVFERVDDGYVLRVANSPLGDIDSPAGDDDMEAGMRQMFMQMMEGLEIVERYNLPGQVGEVQGLSTHEGRTATLRITRDDLMDPDKRGDLPEGGNRTIRIGANEVTDAQVAEFRRELEQAKARWAELKAASQ